MHPSEAFDREEQILDEQFERGELTSEEHRYELRELARDYRAAVEEACQQAYEAEKERW